MTTYTISTSKTKDSPAQQTKITVDWTGATEDMLQQIALSQIIIKVQSNFRRNGIPAEFTIHAVDCVPGNRIAKVEKTIEQLWAEMSNEQRAMLLMKHPVTETE